MDIEIRLRSLESRYRKAMSAAISAKATYLALLEEPGSVPSTVSQARQRWELHESRKREIAARMGEIEDIEPGLIG